MNIKICKCGHSLQEHYPEAIGCSKCLCENNAFGELIDIDKEQVR